MAESFERRVDRYNAEQAASGSGKVLRRTRLSPVAFGSGFDQSISTSLTGGISPTELGDALRSGKNRLVATFMYNGDGLAKVLCDAYKANFEAVWLIYGWHTQLYPNAIPGSWLAAAGCTRSEMGAALDGVLGVSLTNLGSDTHREPGGRLPSQFMEELEQRLAAKGTTTENWGNPHSYDAVMTWALALDEMMSGSGDGSASHRRAPYSAASLQLPASGSFPDATRQDLMTILNATRFWGVSGFVSFDQQTLDRIGGEMTVQTWNSAANRKEDMGRYDPETRSFTFSRTIVWPGGVEANATNLTSAPLL